MIYETNSEKETFELGKNLGEQAKAGQIFCLNGDLGVGKTVFTQVYRIGDPEEMYEIGYEEYFFGEGVCLIEWSKLIEELIPEEAINIEIDKNLEKGLDYRKITVEGL